MRAAILIPAHNEAVVIDRTLTFLLDGLPPEVRVLVLCNGCSDETASIARQCAPRVEVFELPEPSKIGALNFGDRLLTEEGGPARSRVYLDADVEVSGEDMGRILAALEAPGALAAEPIPEYRTHHSSLGVQAFYAVWVGLHGGQRGDLGCGVCAVSAEGRARFGEFPDIIADDGYVRAHFMPAEIATVADARSIVYAEHALADHIRVRSRVRAGTSQLAQRYPELWSAKREATKPLHRKALGLSPRLWPLVPLYLWAQWLIRRRARRMENGGGPIPWERAQRLR